MSISSFPIYSEIHPQFRLIKYSVLKYSNKTNDLLAFNQDHIKIL